MGKAFKYMIVNFIELPYRDIDEYVCVPSAWVRMHRPTDNKVFVAYPVEEQPRTEERVRRRERFSSKWTLFKATVKYEIDSYSEWKTCIKMMSGNNNVPKEGTSSENEDEGGTFKRKSHSSTRNDTFQKNHEKKLVPPLKIKLSSKLLSKSKKTKNKHPKSDKKDKIKETLKCISTKSMEQESKIYVEKSSGANGIKARQHDGMDQAYHNSDSMNTPSDMLNPSNLANLSTWSSGLSYVQQSLRVNVNYVDQHTIVRRTIGGVPMYLTPLVQGVPNNTPSDKENSTNQSFQSEKHFPTVQDNHLKLQKTRPQEFLVERSNNVCLQCNTENMINNNQTVSNIPQQDQRSAEAVYLDTFKDLCGKINSNFADTTAMFDHLRGTFNKSGEIFQRLFKTIKNHSESMNNDVSSSTSTPLVENVTAGIPNRNDNRKKDYSDDTNDDADDYTDDDTDDDNTDDDNTDDDVSGDDVSGDDMKDNTDNDDEA